MTQAISTAIDEPDDALRILVGEPDEADARLLAQTLRGRGYEVDTTVDKATLLARLEERAYDVVVLAWALADATGLEVLREVRARFASPDLPVVLMSNGETEGVVSAFDRGANDVLFKPLNPDVTRVRIHNLVALRRARLELRQLAMVDVLTGVYNRRYIMEVLGRQLTQARRYGRQLSFCLCDIDHFKGVNDSYGHAAGDAALQMVARLLGERLRRADVVGRFGGDELCVIFPETSAANAAIAADAVRSIIAEAPLWVDGQKVSLTVSFGIAEIDEETHLPDILVSNADAALYAAKRLGRNRACTTRDVVAVSGIQALAG